MTMEQTTTAPAPTIEPGLYQGMAFADYLAVNAISASDLKTLSISPKAYLMRQIEEQEDTPSLLLGSAVHTAVLEPERFEKDYTVWTGGRRAGKAWEAFQEEHAGERILTADEYLETAAIARAVREDEVAGPHLAQPGVAESSVIWRTASGILCKSRPDWLTATCIYDLKTTRHIDPEEFGRDAARLGYHIQVAFYVDALMALTGLPYQFKIIAVQNKAPYDVVVYSVPEAAIEAGRKAYMGLMRRLGECIQLNFWPGVACGLERVLCLPEWALNGGVEGGVTLTIGGQAVSL
jgi:hypothetical protein